MNNDEILSLTNRIFKEYLSNELNKNINIYKYSVQHLFEKTNIDSFDKNELVIFSLMPLRIIIDLYNKQYQDLVYWEKFLLNYKEYFIVTFEESIERFNQEWKPCFINDCNKICIYTELTEPLMTLFNNNAIKTDWYRKGKNKLYSYYGWNR